MINYRKIAVVLFTTCLPLVAFASTSDQLQVAVDNGKVAFVLVNETGAAGVDPAKQMIQRAMNQVPGSVMIETNRWNVSIKMRQIFS